jgi:hypothetical protein
MRKSAGLTSRKGTSWKTELQQQDIVIMEFEKGKALVMWKVFNQLIIGPLDSSIELGIVIPQLLHFLLWTHHESKNKCKRTMCIF